MRTLCPCLGVSPLPTGSPCAVFGGRPDGRCVSYGHGQQHDERILISQGQASPGFGRAATPESDGSLLVRLGNGSEYVPRS